MKIELTSAILLISAINGFIFSLIAFAKAKEYRNNKFVGLLLLLSSLLIFDEFTRWTEDFFTLYPQFTYIFTVAWFLVIPAVYILVRAQLYYTGFEKVDFLHLIPLTLQLLNSRGFFSAPDLKRGILEGYFQTHEPHDAKIVFGLQIIVYLILIYRALKRKYNYSFLDVFGKMTPWLQSIYIILIAYLLAIIVIILSVELADHYLRWLDLGKTYLFLLVIYGWLLSFIYYPLSLKHPIKGPEIWLDQFNFESLSDRLNSIINKMEKGKIYTMPDLKVLQIANETEVPARILTECVNDELGINVPQLVNLLRIKEMEKMVGDQGYQNLTLMGIASEAGFRSKASLYRSVKEFTGKSPSEYFKEFAPRK